MSGNRSLSITFVAGARSVTGAQFLVEAVEDDRTTKVLVDCGLTQGSAWCDPTNANPFPYQPGSVNALFVTHAHTDHIGLIPKVVKEGFAGKIYTTAETAALMPIMLEDTAHLLALEAKRCNETPLYEENDLAQTFRLIERLAYKKPLELAPGITATLYNAGHILGSATVLLDVWGTRVLFTGDLGRTPAVLVPDRDAPEGPIHYLVTESVYGNQAHEDYQVSKQTLLQETERTLKNGGVLLIPSFSLERTQIILAALDTFVREKLIHGTSVLLDSPLAEKVTEVYRAHPSGLRDTVREQLERGDDPFNFPGLATSKAADPSIIIAGAGMSHGGRIRRHEAHYLPLPNATLLLVGYQVPGSLGRRLQDGARSVTIDGKKVKVRARVVKTSGFSAHADRDELLAYAEAVKPQEAFVVLGEMDAATFLAQRLSGFLGIPTTIPQKGEKINLNLIDI